MKQNTIGIFWLIFITVLSATSDAENYNNDLESNDFYFDNELEEDIVEPIKSEEEFIEPIISHAGIVRPAICGYTIDKQCKNVCTWGKCGDVCFYRRYKKCY